jgi:hypothetical protein
MKVGPFPSHFCRYCRYLGSRRALSVVNAATTFTSSANSKEILT